MPNAELAARILSEITDHPAHYNQEHWVDGVDLLLPTDDLADGALDCGTTLCVAGYATHLSGYIIEHCQEESGEFVAYKPGQPSRRLHNVARDELGLSDADAFWLFNGLRTPDQVHAALRQVAAGADTMPRT